MPFQPKDLHVIAVVNNPVRYESRYRLYQDFEKRMQLAGVNLITVEAAFYDRKFELTNSSNSNHIQVRQRDELWLKENLIKIGAEHLPQNWEYVAWVDADVEFLRPDWPVETIHQLQHYKVVQMFQNAMDMGPNSECLTNFNSFGYSYAHDLPKCTISEDVYSYDNGKFWHPGFAWAMDRQTWDDLGGLLDMPILGSADHHMALGLIGEASRSLPGGIHENYRAEVMRWQERAEFHVRRDVGYVPGTLVHHWHGKKRDRRYQDRWNILTKHNFDPLLDIKRDWQGVITLTHQGERMRHDLRTYFRSRNEDSVDLE